MRMGILIILVDSFFPPSLKVVGQHVNVAFAFAFWLASFRFCYNNSVISHWNLSNMD